jgi:hypothetical protein
MYPGPHATQLASAPRRKRSVWPVVAVVAVLVVGAFAGGWFAGRAGLVEPVVDPRKGETFTYGEGGDIPELEVSPGYCGSSPLAKGRGVPSSVSCDELHDFEMVYSTELYQSEDMDYPGKDRLTTLGESTCAVVFNDNAHVLENQRGSLSYVTLLPGEAAWRDLENGNQAVFCAVRKTDRSQLSEPVTPQQ